MGEARAGGLRADAMDEVIFAGARGRPARNLAEVALVLDRDGEEVEIVRRIARAEGSAYTLNGREARQRDIQLLFADAATGAHAAALVGQGRVAAVIAAKPAERRQMLEEAAGIAGLAVRRKEAETRLKAAAANLARVEDLGGELGTQVVALKRQARAAERYGELSTRIRVAEAALLFAGWREADARADAALRDVRAAEAGVEAARGAIAAAEDARTRAARSALAARDAEGAARVDAERAARALETLAEDRARTARRRAELEASAAALARDRARETALLDEARAGCAKAEAAAAALEDAGPARALDRARAQREETEATVALTEAEAALADALDARARATAEHAAAGAAVMAARAALMRRTAELEQIARDRAALGEAADVTPRATQAGLTAQASPGTGGIEAAAAALAASDTAAAEARTRLAAATVAAASARTDASSVDARADALGPPLAAARARVAALEGEESALARAASPAMGVTSRAAIRVRPGIEAALAAALGDDLDAPVGRAGEGWARIAATADDPPLPPGCAPLAADVTGPPELARRLAQVGLVASAEAGAALAPALRPGQRLVTSDGALWRWDGFDLARPASLATAQRLRAANRLAELAADLAPARAELAEREAAVAAVTAERSAAAEALGQSEAARVAAERAAADADRAVAARRAVLDRARVDAEHQAARARAAAEAAQAAARREADVRAARRAALTAAGERLEAERARAAEDLAVAEAARAAAADPDAAIAAADTARAAALAARAASARAADRAAAAARTEADAARALDAARADAVQWAARAASADARLAELAPRAEAVAADLAARPPAAAQTLGTPVDAEAAAGAAADATRAELRDATAVRAAAEGAQAAAEAALAALSETMAGEREARATAAANAAHAARAREELRRAALDRFQCEPPQLARRYDFPPEASVATRESELDRLSRERDRLGPVNLRAVAELADASGRADALSAERAEVDTAIARLRGSIGALNRDGRARLLATFEGVDRRFRQLFATLFDGGEARLALIDSDDPLDAGLEIVAKPPGKSPQSLALLSGGEQALTAVALLFAFFLENPSPICVLDEVDAPLDDANVERFCDLLREVARGTATRFLIVTHNPVTMSAMDRLYGVTMAEPGVSQLVSVDLAAAEAMLATG